MRPASSRELNPDFRDPREYLKTGFFGPDGKTLRPELRAERAVAMARELLIRAVPLELVAGVAQAIARLAASAQPFAERRAWLLERGHDPRLRRHPQLVRLLQAGAAAVRRPEDLAGLAEHLKRVHQLAQFERLLGRANELERLAAEARATRGARVRALKRRRGDGPL